MFGFPAQQFLDYFNIFHDLMDAYSQQLITFSKVVFVVVALSET